MEHEHHRRRLHFHDTTGLWGFNACCCALWSVALAALGLAIAAFVLVLVLNSKQGKQIEDCCAADAALQDLGDGESFAICGSGSGVIGVTNSSGYTDDNCDGFFIVMSRFVTPNGVGGITTIDICAEFGAIDDPAPGFTAAIYGDDGFGVPTALIANTSTSLLTGNALNCLPIPATLSEGEYIWLAVMTEGSTCDVTNNLLFATHPYARSIQSDAFAYPTWPTEIAPGYDYLSYVYSMQLSYNATCVSPA
jgi:hypothetical protein